jgi:hypothetical protein
MTQPFKTISELMTEAGSATSEAACDLLLTAAMVQATKIHEWEEILDHLPPAASQALKRTLVERTVDCARASRSVLGFYCAAMAQAQVLGDAQAARATLAAAEEMRSTQLPAHEWMLLARAYLEALADHAQVLRILTIAWGQAWAARDIHDLGWVVKHWAELIDRTEAVERLGRVEEAAAEWGDLADVSYWWCALGDAQAARRTRQRTLEAQSFNQLLCLVQYLKLRVKEESGIKAAVARAEALASTASEWFELAKESLTDEPRCRELARRALDRAADVAEDHAIKVRIACAYVDWFNDEAAADRLGPRGVRPDDLRPRITALTAWPSNAAALLDWLCDRITPAGLSRIAEADRGLDEEYHLAALELICRTRLLPFELAWCPHEVLALTRWGSREKDPVVRAFACVVLLLASDEDEIVHTGAILIENCLDLGEEAAALAVQLFAWRYETTDPDEDDAPLTLLLLALMQAAYHPEDPRIGELIRQIGHLPAVPNFREWIADSLCAALWSELIQTILPRLRQCQPELSTELDALNLPE